MDVQINKQNGESFTLSEHGIIVKDFIVSSIPIISEYGEIEGRHGTVDYGATYGTRTITVPFRLQAYDLMDFPLMRDVLFGLVIETESFYIRELRRIKKLQYKFADTTEPPRMDPESENKFVGGKRYLVRLQNTFDIEQIEADGEGELVFETTELPFAESIGTTQDLHKNGIDFDSGLWGFGMGLLTDENSLIYTHNATVAKPFRIYNAGNVPIHPFDQKLKITISNVMGSTDSFQIINLTNMSKLKINTALSTSDTVVFDGANITRNGLSFTKNTDKNFIELESGWNNLRIYFCDSATIEFDFPFYYK